MGVFFLVPGYTHFATSIDMALTLGPSLDVRVETSEQLSSQLAKSQRESKELKEKLLRAEAKAYLLAKHLRDHSKFVLFPVFNVLFLKKKYK